MYSYKGRERKSASARACARERDRERERERERKKGGMKTRRRITSIAAFAYINEHGSGRQYRSRFAVM